MEDDSPSSLQSLALQARAFFSEIIGKDQKSPIPSTPGTVSSRASHDSDDTLLESAQTQSSIGITDFFSLDVIQMALHDPSISHQLLKFSQAQHCGENVEFVQKVDRYNRLLKGLTKLLSEINDNFTADEAPDKLNVEQKVLQRVTSSINNVNETIVPTMAAVFKESQSQIEQLVSFDIYPRFIKHQMALSAMRALTSTRSKYAGLGDCFCLSDPLSPDNPLVSVSDGFLKVTGYSRSEVIPHNCRFLQGRNTDQAASRRVQSAILAREESVELILNYKKNGEPFWNLLYIAPLFTANGRHLFWLGAQINCSTTVHNRSDILRILSASPKENEFMPELISSTSTLSQEKCFFKRTSQEPNPPNISSEQHEAGMEQKLMGKLEGLNVKSQMSLFYTAYSKYLVLSYDSMQIEFFSAGVARLLSLKYGQALTEFIGHDVFKTMARHTVNMPRDYKTRVKDSMVSGRAISEELNLVTRFSPTDGSEPVATHWTPMKNEHGKVEWVIVALARIT